MKLLPFVLMCALIMILGDVFSQEQAAHPELHLEIGHQKPISIVFSTPIVTVTNSNQKVITQISGRKNALQVSVGEHFFPESAIEVVTEDGQHHHFVVNYSHQPFHSQIRMPYQFAPAAAALNPGKTAIALPTDEIPSEITKHPSEQTDILLNR